MMAFDVQHFCDTISHSSKCTLFNSLVHRQQHDICVCCTSTLYTWICEFRFFSFFICWEAKKSFSTVNKMCALPIYFYLYLYFFLILCVYAFPFEFELTGKLLKNCVVYVDVERHTALVGLSYDSGITIIIIIIIIQWQRIWCTMSDWNGFAAQLEHTGQSKKQQQKKTSLAWTTNSTLKYRHIIFIILYTSCLSIEIQLLMIILAFFLFASLCLALFCLFHIPFCCCCCWSDSPWAFLNETKHWMA